MGRFTLDLWIVEANPQLRDGRCVGRIPGKGSGLWRCTPLASPVRRWHDPSMRLPSSKTALLPSGAFRAVPVKRVRLPSPDSLLQVVAQRLELLFELLDAVFSSLLQVFLISCLDAPEFFACSRAMQSFIAWL